MKELVVKTITFATVGVICMCFGCAPAEESNVVLDPSPYGIEKRPLPKDFENDTLAPKKLGSFERISIEDAEDSEPGVRMRYAQYQKPGSDSTPLSVGIFVHETAAAAQKSMASQYGVTPNETEKAKKADPTIQVRLGTDPSYYRHPWSGESADFYFTRGRVGYLVQAWKGEEELDEFMASFPY